MKYSRQQTPAQKSKLRYLVVAIIVIALGIGGFFTYKALQKDPAKSASNSQDPKEGTPETRPDTINYDGPTPEEVQAGNQQKETNAQNEGNQSGTPPSSANVTISDASQYGQTVEVRGYVSNVYDDGTCTATFTKSGSPTVTTTSTVIKDAAVVQCGANDTDRSKFDKTGTWQLTLRYTAENGVTGTATRSVEIK